MRGSKIIMEHIKDDYEVLDVGGAFHPCARANVIIDAVPYNYYGNMVERAYPRHYPIHFSEENYFQFDVSKSAPWPFKDKEFDFVICSQTLEDVRDPFWVCKEMIRIGKRGYIETPSRFSEQTQMSWMGMVGYHHHRWLVEIKGNKILFVFKAHNIHHNPKYRLLRPPLNFAVNPKYEAIHLLWETEFEYEEKLFFNDKEYENYLHQIHEKVKDIDDYFIPKACVRDGCFDLNSSPRKVIRGKKAIPGKLWNLSYKFMKYVRYGINLVRM